MDKDDYQHHISRRFNEDLSGVSAQLMRMGGLAQQMVDDAIKSLIDANVDLAGQVVNMDHMVDSLEMAIDERCLLIIARRQPAASDLRLVIAVTKAITDLERVGDEASKIARQAISLAHIGSSSHGLVEVRHIGNRVAKMLAEALDAFARLDMDLALKVVETDKTVDMEYATALRELISFMIEDPRSITRAINVLWSLRALERIGDHSRNLAQYVIYLVKGEDVRHENSPEHLNEIINNNSEGL